MHNIYKYLAMAMLGCLTVWYLPILAAKPRMVCPNDGKRPYFGVCLGGEEPVPAAEVTSDRRDDSRPPVNTTTSERPQTKIGDCNASRRPGGGKVDCPPKEVVTPTVETSRLSFEPEMVQITGGTFMMGSPDGKGHSDEHPQHEVTVGDFAIGKYEVTQGQWQAVMGNNPSNFSSCGERCPVETVNWDDVQDYIAKLNAKTGKTYRLPTEAEWEYACRGGAVGETYCGGNDVDSLAWYDGNSGGKPHSVGGKAANGFGLFDMSGNVGEWTCSQYDSNGYSGKETTCANKGNSVARAVRGGSWGGGPGGGGAAYRFVDVPSYRNDYSGFRLVQD